MLLSAASKSILDAGLRLEEVDCDSFWVQTHSGTEALARIPTQVGKWTDGIFIADSLFTRQYAHQLRLPELCQATPRVTDMDSAVEQFLEALSSSVKVRVEHILHRNEAHKAGDEGCKTRVQEHASRVVEHKASDEGCNNRYSSADVVPANLAVLFSGGLDCTTLALLAHKHLPPQQAIDLFNVAFENPRSLQAAAKGSTTSNSTSIYDVPDRRTGRESYRELVRVAPHRKWNFVEINVPHAEYARQRSTIETLMFPNASVMDLSIAAALYFASRGTGAIQDSHRTYTSPARVLLSGLGADELLGGYSRHRKAHQQGHGDSKALVEELQMDLDRLPSRNLGRDDRILSSSGKEARYPFLSYTLRSHLASLPVHVKMDLSLDPGQGDKRLLRLAARLLGLAQTSTLTKRAIQFGARSAKMDVGDGRVKGHERLVRV